MKFWQKSFFWILLLFLVAFDVMGYFLVERSFDLNQEYALSAAETEQHIIAESVFEKIEYLSDQYEELNESNLRDMIVPYAGYYANQGVTLALYQGETEVFSNNPKFQPNAEPGTDKRAAFQTLDGRYYCVIEENMSSPLSDLHLVYMKDAQSLKDFKSGIANVFVTVSIIVSLILSAVLLILLINLTRPFRRLSEMASEITAGNYDKRVAVRGKDEISAFAGSFNTMADRVEEHIGALSRMNESKEQFINNLAHEMRTPVTAILGYAELLKIGNIEKAEQTKSLDYIIGQSRRVKDMVYKLMDLAYMSTANIEHIRLDMKALAANAIATCTAPPREKNVRITTDIDPVDICGDAALIETLMQNLIENAIKASPEKGCVAVKVYDDQGERILAITDNGVGMEPSEISKVTEPFYRVDPARTRADGGVGLGLALCARICELHEARIEISSKPGCGTTVRVGFGGLPEQAS